MGKNCLGYFCYSKSYGRGSLQSGIILIFPINILLKVTRTIYDSKEPIDNFLHILKEKQIKTFTPVSSSVIEAMSADPNYPRLSYFLPIVTISN